MNFVRKRLYIKLLMKDYSELSNAIYFYFAGANKEKRKYVEKILDEYKTLVKYSYGSYLDLNRIPEYIAEKLIAHYHEDLNKQRQAKKEENIAEINEIFN